MSSRRNVLIRTVAAIAGDIATGIAAAAACAWFIEFATLGLFLSFLVWLVAALLALAMSQHVVHPAVNALLCDHKLDAVIDAASTLTDAAQGWTRFAFAALQARVRPA